MSNTTMCVVATKFLTYDEMMQVSHKLSQSDIDYNPAFPRMNIQKQDVFKYHVISALWDIAHSM